MLYVTRDGETGMDDNRNGRYCHGYYLHESWMTWHEGMLSGGYEIRRLTGKLNLTGNTWIRGCGWTEIMSCGFAIAHHDEKAWG